MRKEICEGANLFASVDPHLKALQGPQMPRSKLNRIFITVGDNRADDLQPTEPAAHGITSHFAVPPQHMVIYKLYNIYVVSIVCGTIVRVATLQKMGTYTSCNGAENMVVHGIVIALIRFVHLQH